jgi:sporulation protein YlmC with PRC-barrel domain
MSERYYTRKDVENKIVVELSGKEAGTAKDLAFSQDGRTALVVGTKEGKEIEIPMSRVLGVMDYIVLSSEEPRTQTTPGIQQQIPQPLANCPKCNAPFKPGAKFCTKCGKKF